MQGSLATKLRVMRAERGLTLRQAAPLLGVRPGTLSELERGARHPHDLTLAKIAKGYGVPVEELLEEAFPLASAPSASLSPDAGAAGAGLAEASLPPQTMGRLLEEAGAEGRELALPHDEFKRLYDGLSYEEAVRLNRKILAQRRAIDPILRRRLTMPPSEDRSTLYRLWEQALARMFSAADVHTAMAREAARAESDATRAEEIMRLAATQAKELAAAA